jgi:putative NADPH-quinone reductase
MNVLIVLAHPEAQSFNAHLARIAETVLAEGGMLVQRSDLYAEHFDPSEGPRHFRVLRHPERFDAQTEQRFSHENRLLSPEVEREMARILWADVVILQFPLWWFGLPAALKGWMDRVFVYGGLYSGSCRHDSGFCRCRGSTMHSFGAWMTRRSSLSTRTRISTRQGVCDPKHRATARSSAIFLNSTSPRPWKRRPSPMRLVFAGW